MTPSQAPSDTPTVFAEVMAVIYTCPPIEGACVLGAPTDLLFQVIEVTGAGDISAQDVAVSDQVAVEAGDAVVTLQVDVSDATGDESYYIYEFVTDTVSERFTTGQLPYTTEFGIVWGGNESPTPSATSAPTTAPTAAPSSATGGTTTLPNTGSGIPSDNSALTYGLITLATFGGVVAVGVGLRRRTA